MSENKLIEAAKMGNLKKLQKIIKAGADVNDKDNDGFTALMYAALYGLTDCVALLIKSGADINATDKFGRTAIIHAAWNGHIDCINFLNEKYVSILGLGLAPVKQEGRATVYDKMKQGYVTRKRLRRYKRKR